MTRRDVDVVIVGAGIGGLTAAAWLRSRGLRVHVLEALSEPGGKAGTVVVDGASLDTGPSVLTMPEVFDEAFGALGTSLDAEVALRRPSPFFRYVFPSGATFDVHPTLAATLESARASLGADAARELESFLGYARRIWEAAAPAFVFGAAPTPLGIMRLGPRMIASVTRIDALRSMKAAIAARIRSPELRVLLERYATYNGSDPRFAPATLNCIAHVELTLGGSGVEGGIQALVRALVSVLEAHGVVVELGASVARIRMRGGRAIGVELADGRTIDARAVVANADATAVFSQLLPSQVGAKHVPTTEPSMSGWTAIVRARRRARPAHVALFPRAYDDEFTDVFDRDRPPREPTVYLCAQEPCHGIAGWPDAEPVFVMVNAPAEPEVGGRDDAIWSALREAVIARLRAAGQLEDGDQVVWERTPAGLAARFPGTRGSIYGAASTSRTAAFRRPANRVPGVPGLYLASGSAHPGGGLPLAALSGRAAAAVLLEDLRERTLPPTKVVR